MSEMRFSRGVIYVTSLVAIWPPAALAYLDPGTGSIILQGLLAAIAGTLVAGRLYWSRLKSFFARKPPSTPEEQAETGKLTAPESARPD